jgi:predicted nuclease of predicted toxin-antitoxin system
VRLLFDQNLSRTLVGGLRGVFPESQHVTALDLDTAKDREIVESVLRACNDETPATAGVSHESG